MNDLNTEETFMRDCTPSLSTVESETSLAIQWLRVPFPMRGCGFNPWLEAKIPQASVKKKNQNTKQKQYCNKYKKDF